MQVLGEGAQQRAALVGEARGQPRRGIERVGDLEELRRFEASAARRALDRRADVVGAADPDAGSLLEERRGSGRSRRGPRATMTGSLDGSSVSARRRDGGNEVASASRARTAGNSSRTIERWSTADLSDGRPARRRTGDRRG